MQSFRFTVILPPLFISMLNLFLYSTQARAALSENTSCTTPEPPTCLEDGEVATGCLDLIDRIHEDVDTNIEYHWGRHFENIGESADCVIVVLLEPPPRNTPAFVLLDYLDVIRDLYQRCVVSGTCKGGYVNIGPHDRIPILIQNFHNDGDAFGGIENFTSPACASISDTMDVISTEEN